MAVADDLVWLYERAGLGAYGTTIFVGAKASLPDGTILTIRVEPGQGIEGTHNMTDVPAYVKASAQVVARAVKYTDAEALALAAFLVTYKVRNQFVNGTWWRDVTMTQAEPFDLGEDDQARPRIAFNFGCTKRLSPATS